MLLSLIIILLQPAFASGQNTYNQFKANSKIIYNNSEIIVKDKKIKLNTYIYDGIELSKLYFNKSVYVATRISLDTISDGYKTSCDSGAKLDIIQISFDDMNKPGSISSDEKVLGNLWGFFDPGDYYANRYTILIANHTEYSNHTIVAHEVAHYWFERLCVSDDRKSSSEDFAKYVELRYIDYFNSY